jgi:hypothetical protein
VVVMVVMHDVMVHRVVTHHMVMVARVRRSDAH